MKTNHFLTLTISLILGLSNVSCEKEGPAGPQGPAGADGNANVQSENISVLSSEWDGDGFLYLAQKNCDIITQVIADEGAVLCYLKGTNDTYTPLPFSISAGNWTTHIGFEHAIGEIVFFFQDDDGLTPQPGFRTFKVVAIESRTLELYPNIADMAYEDVMQIVDKTIEAEK